MIPVLFRYAERDGFFSKFALLELVVLSLPVALTFVDWKMWIPWIWRIIKQLPVN